MEEKKATRSGKKHRRKRLLLKVFIVLSLFFIVAGLVTSFQIYSMVQSAPEINDNTFDFVKSSTVFDQNDEPMVSLDNGEHRKPIKVENIPKHVQDAFIAIEDLRFHEHSGLDFRRIGGAVLSNITDGFGSEGGSTITQQVVKNSLLTSEKTIERKVQEAYLALELEKEYTKDEILELYFNKIYFGNGAYGILTAANTYFGKSIEELTTEEAALLAGLPQRPSGYDPYQNPELAEERRNTVLFAMNAHGFLTEEEYTKAKSVPIEDMIKEKSRKEEISDAFMDQVFKELKNIEGLDSSTIYNGGLKIYTTYDKEAQEHVEKVLNSDEFISYPDDRFQAGVVLLDNRTGEIKAIGGGRNQDPGKNRSNYATNIERSPGSTIKPILSYGPAIEYLKWSTYQQIEDEEITYTGSEQIIQNYDDNYHGIVSMREALKQSWNIPAVKTFKEVGSKRAGEFAANVGLPFEEPIYESYALGSFKKGISPLELAGAYSAFGNEGTFNKPHAVKKVVFPNGKEINLQSDPVVAMSDYTSYMVTDMLQTVVEEGTGRNARIEGVTVAGKTGTTNFNEETKQKYNISEGVPDVWFAGYTSNYTAAVWTGYPSTSEKNYIKTREDRQIAQHIFREVMTKIAQEDIADFKKPRSVEEITINTKTGERTTKRSNNANIVTELFVRGTAIEDAYSLVEEEWEKKQSKSNYQPKQTNPNQNVRTEENATPNSSEENFPENDEAEIEKPEEEREAKDKEELKEKENNNQEEPTEDPQEGTTEPEPEEENAEQEQPKEEEPQEEQNSSEDTTDTDSTNNDAEGRNEEEEESQEQDSNSSSTEEESQEQDSNSSSTEEESQEQKSNSSSTEEDNDGSEEEQDKSEEES
ncbi:transglycosylase domain-containing protein [Bacillus solitudinis]|uniref:transglycosylase domain-containing protein n=1 Tax=Bacillus solitudinis TaxID=2014074 RepID=UPI000C23D440|nr:PBP1A family penicillin-binding protein [Bacillus solitudinis]